MARLYDRMLQQGFSNPFLDGDGLRHLQEQISTALKRAVPIAIDNVADYLYAGTDQENWDTQKDFPNVAPPFETFWMEYRTPRVIRIKGRPDWRNEGPGGHFGLLFAASDLRDLDAISFDDPEHARFLERSITEMWREHGPEIERARVAVERTGQAPRDLSHGAKALIQMVRALDMIRKGTAKAEIQKEVGHGTRWGLEVIAFVEQNGLRWGPVCSWMLLIHDDGSVADCSHQFMVVSPLQAEYLHDHGEGLGELNQIIFPGLLALSFMHCKNVQMIDNPVPIKLNKSRASEGKEPFVSFKTLEIEPMKRVLASQGRSGVTGIKQALHICRGHFADYRDGLGLFGKHHGLYWWDAHVRGSAKVGTIVKDYAVNAGGIGR